MLYPLQLKQDKNLENLQDLAEELVAELYLFVKPIKNSLVNSTETPPDNRISDLA